MLLSCEGKSDLFAHLISYLSVSYSIVEYRASRTNSVDGERTPLLHGASAAPTASSPIVAEPQSYADSQVTVTYGSITDLTTGNGNTNTTTSS